MPAQTTPTRPASTAAGRDAPAPRSAPPPGDDRARPAGAPRLAGQPPLAATGSPGSARLADHIDPDRERPCPRRSTEPDLTEPRRSVPRSVRAPGPGQAENSTSDAGRRRASAAPHGHGNGKPLARRPRQWSGRCSHRREQVLPSPKQRLDAPSEQHARERLRRSPRRRGRARAGRSGCALERLARYRGTPRRARLPGRDRTAADRQRSGRRCNHSPAR